MSWQFWLFWITFNMLLGSLLRVYVEEFRTWRVDFDLCIG